MLEVFTDSALESEALRLAHNVRATGQDSMKQLAKDLLGPRGMRVARRLMGR